MRPYRKHEDTYRAQHSGLSRHCHACSVKDGLADDFIRCSGESSGHECESEPDEEGEMVLPASNGISSRLRIPDPTAPVPIVGTHNFATLIPPRGQRERRARILAATRFVIGRKIEEDVTIRDVASRSQVAAQTIYNLIGNRAQLVEDAINEHISYTAIDS